MRGMSIEMKCKVIIVGGFLGAGKTSLLWETALRIKNIGINVGLITNDQASELVDTAFLETEANLVKEVSGSCFCCNFNGFVDAIFHVSEKNSGGIVVAEPVGSCTDLSATLIQPLKDKYKDKVDLAPLTVLADPIKLKEILQSASGAMNYIVLKQFEEADIILINKTDLLSSDELNNLIILTQSRWQNTKIMTTSVKTGEGINEWLDVVLSKSNSGEKIAEVDYDIYAQGEAELGWLNATYEIKRTLDFEGFKALANEFVQNLSEYFDREKIAVGHVKFSLQTADKQFVGNITGDKSTAEVRVRDIFSENNTLIVNARAKTDPDTLEKIVSAEIEKLFNNLEYVKVASKSLIPGRPIPTHRYRDVI